VRVSSCISLELSKQVMHMDVHTKSLEAVCIAPTWCREILVTSLPQFEGAPALSLFTKNVNPLKTSTFEMSVLCPHSTLMYFV
jgi:hypothetical protein